MEKRDNSGALFTNDKKTKETHPDMNGKITILGREFYISAWKKQSNNGKNYLSLSIKPVEDQASVTKKIDNPTYSQDISDFLNDF
jgi:uncharacterized protein (DUF736 family)